MSAPRSPNPAASGHGGNLRKQVAMLLKSEGTRVVADGYAGIVKADGERRARRILAAYHPDHRAVYLNQQSPYWGNPDSYLARFVGGIAIYSSRDHFHPAYHEQGHRLFHERVGDSRYRAARGEPLDLAQVNIVREEVGYAASFSVVEFVSEVYAAIRAGRVLHKAIMILYNALGGPIP